MASQEARIDKWLWAARIFKTRTLATAACRKGQVSMGGAQLKASRTVKAGDVVSVRKPPVTYSFKVLQPIEKRVGARLLPEILENVTPQERLRTSEISTSTWTTTMSWNKAGTMSHTAGQGLQAPEARP